jgi:TonB-linked SusC/RagA family outer membrane protein
VHTSLTRGAAVMGFILAIGAPVRAQNSATPQPRPGRGARAPVGSAAQHVASPLERRVTLDVRGARLEAVLQEIDRQADLGLTYTPRVVPIDRRVTFRADSMTAGQALRTLLRGTGIDAVLTPGGTVMLVRAEGAVRDTVPLGAITGMVRDSATGRPLKGASVAVYGTGIVGVTNDSGAYFFAEVPVGRQTVTARYLGYRMRGAEVVVAERQVARADILLPYGLTRLQEVVTTATGPKRRLELGNDITRLDADSIVNAAPVSSFTDLLATRVPGLDVRPTTGAPGDPSRLRLRGISSVFRSNDPVVIVDGIRVYSAQSDSARGGNLVATHTVASNPTPLPAPSPLDAIDPNSIESVEVFKGPSAATLYGPDAANGVIVVTTKKGKPGPPRWTASVERGITYIPGSYPESYLRFGHDVGLGGGVGRLCHLTDYACQGDSLVAYQLLNDSRYTVLGHGDATAASVGVSGGSDALQYAITGSLQAQNGLLKLPSIEASGYQALHGSPPPSWMQRPHQFRQWGVTSRLTARLGAHGNAAATSMVSRSKQQRSSLEDQLGTLMGIYVDPVSGTYYRPSGSSFQTTEVLVPDFYRRTTDDATNFTNSLSLGWTPTAWLTTGANAGINVITRSDEALLPNGVLASDTGGSYSIGHGNSVVRTVNANADLHVPLRWGVQFKTSVGTNFTQTTINDLSTFGRGLAPGQTSIDGAGIVSTAERKGDETTFGWYVEPSISHKRLWLSGGVRIDGGNTYGSHVSFAGFPKLTLSWLASDEPFFPFKSFFNTLRLRGAYGRAGVQPGPTDRLRLYELDPRWLDGQTVSSTLLTSLGNTHVRPERSTEWEGGFDADLLDNRVSVSLTGYRKMRYDALMRVPVPPSLYGSRIQTLTMNVGTIRNTGIEATLATDVVRTDLLSWGLQLHLARNRNDVLSLGDGVTPFDVPGSGRVQAGYPLFGVWARPVTAYFDQNDNGIIDPTEIQVGDTAIFLGPSLPNYEAAIYTSVSLFRRRVTVQAGFDYQDGLTQINRTILTNQAFARAANDATAPMGQQAAVVALSQTQYGLIQTISTFRFNSLSVTYAVPTPVARRLGASALFLSLRGTNLGLYSKYDGKDPNVNAYTTGNATADTGQLPLPRTWQLRLSATY